MKGAIVLLLGLLLAAPALGAGPAIKAGGGFSDPSLEARARNLQRQLRCLVCQGESIDESGSAFAADIRRLVRQDIAHGMSDRQIEDFLVARYGDFILMKPPLQADTWLLWLGPFGVLAVAGVVAAVTIRRAAQRSLKI